MLNNPKLTHLIWWTDTQEQNVFALYPGKEFANALTGYFKHGNVASFVRQLHMYGFHKVSDPNLSQLDKDSPPVWEFKHSLGKFKKNDEKSLVYIKRRSSSNNSTKSNSYSNPSHTNVIDHKEFYDVPQQQNYISYQQPHLPPPHLSPAPPLHHPHVMAPMYFEDYKHQPNFAPQQPIQIPQIQPQQDIGSHDSPSVHKQEQIPQFRKVWKESNDNPRRRNPSLLYDPLAPVPTAHTLTPPHPSSLHHYSQQAYQHQHQQPGYPSHNLPSSSVTPTPIGLNSASAPASISGPPRTSYSSTLLSSTVSYNGSSLEARKPHSISGYERDIHSRNSMDSRLSIKLPIPSIHQKSMKFNESNDHRMTPTQMESPPISRLNSNIIPTKRPSLNPISSSLQDVLRPSLVDLHYNHRSTPTSSNGPHDSIVSTSSNHNSIFSNKSSFASLSSQKRNSSFGSISMPPFSKNSISVCPHEEQQQQQQLRQEPQQTSKEESDQQAQELPNTPSFKEPKRHNSNPNMARTFSPSLPSEINKQLLSPTTRPSTSIPIATSKNGLNEDHRSLNASPLTVSVTKSVDQTSESAVDAKPALVHINSLLDTPSGITKIESLINSDSTDTEKQLETS